MKRVVRNVFFVGFLLVLVAFPIGNLAHGDDNKKEGPRPGEENPVAPNRMALFRDDEVFMVVRDWEHQKMVYRVLAPGNADLTEWDLKEGANMDQKGDFGHIAIASGRIANPLQQDDVVVAFYDPQGNYQVELWRSSKKIAWKTFVETAGNDFSFVDVTVGDLDQLVDEDGYYHDEIVFVRNVGNDYYTNKLLVDVMDQDLKTLASVSVSSTDPATYGGVTIGDFDGDGILEIATGLTGAGNLHKDYQIDIFHFIRSNASLSLEKVVTKKFAFTKTNIASLLMEAGDFNGDGRDDIAVSPHIGHFDLLTMLTSDKNNLELERKTTYQYQVLYDSHTYIGSQQSMVSGLFKFEPNSGYGINRRQLATCTAVVWNAGFKDANPVRVRLFSIRDDWSVEPFGTQNLTNEAVGLSPNITAGNFVGHQGNNTSPLMDIAISYVARQDQGLRPKLKILGLRNGSLKDIYTWGGLIQLEKRYRS